MGERLSSFGYTAPRFAQAYPPCKCGHRAAVHAAKVINDSFGNHATIPGDCDDCCCDRYEAAEVQRFADLNKPDSWLTYLGFVSVKDGRTDDRPLLAQGVKLGGVPRSWWENSR